MPAMGSQCRALQGLACGAYQFTFVVLCIASSFRTITTFTHAYATGFRMNRFNSSSLITLGDSFVTDKLEAAFLTSRMQDLGHEEYRLYPLSHAVGRVLYPEPIRGLGVPATGGRISFSTTFIFSIVNPSGEAQIGDGLAFIMVPDNQTVGGGGGYLGVLSNDTASWPSSHIVAVEFDTWKNPMFGDPDGNHVGIDLNSMNSTRAETAGYYADILDFAPVFLTGNKMQAWIDYSAETMNFEVTISPILGIRPARPLLVLGDIDLAPIMKETMYVGFAAATGELEAEHILHAWSFNTTGPAQELVLPDTHSESQVKMILTMTGIIGACCVFFFSMSMWAIYRRRQRVPRIHIGDPLYALEYLERRFDHRSSKEVSFARLPQPSNTPANAKASAARIGCPDEPHLTDSSTQTADESST